jgi:hypothetical protein
MEATGRRITELPAVRIKARTVEVALSSVLRPDRLRTPAWAARAALEPLLRDGLTAELTIGAILAVMFPTWAPLGALSLLRATLRALRNSLRLSVLAIVFPARSALLAGLRLHGLRTSWRRRRGRGRRGARRLAAAAVVMMVILWRGQG